MDEARAREVLARRRAARERVEVADGFVAEWFAEQRGFYDDESRLVAAICGRRAGKTRGGNRHYVRQAMKTPHGRFLYINETRNECKRLAWHGARGDGMASLVERLDLPAVTNESELTIRFPALDSWIYLIGADDEAGVKKALGMPYHEVWWDEAQKIPSKLSPTIRDVLMPTLLDYRGRFRLTGTAVRQMSGLFYEITQTNKAKRMKGWNVHHWNLLANPYFGRAKQIDGAWFVVWRDTDERVSGPHRQGELAAAVAGSRWVNGMLALQELLGGPEVAPLDSPTMRREGFGEWSAEDSNHVYWVNKVPDDKLCYAPHRRREDGFVDIAAALNDLPGWDVDTRHVERRPYFLAFGNDLGTRDDYAFTLWAWSLRDPILYEVASFKRPGLDYDQMGAYMRAVRECVPIGITTADAGGGGKPAVMGWSKDWQSRYDLPIVEATKTNKYQAIQHMNADIVNGRIRFRDGGPLLAEMRDHQWSSVVSATGKLVEDPTTANHCCLVAGTTISTAEGLRPIESIAAGDLVWTRSGLRSVTAAWCTGTRATWRLEAADGVLVGTADHPIWTQRGWIKLGNLTPDDMVIEWASTGHPSASSSSGQSTGATQSRTIDRCVCTTRQVPERSCIATCGQQLAGRFRRVITSITSTAIRWITASRISRVSIAVSTPGITHVSTQSTSESWQPSALDSARPAPPRRSGTGPTRDAGGTPSMQLASSPTPPCSLAPAPCAVVASRRSEARPSAAQAASRSAGESLASMMSIASARSASEPSNETSTPAPATAPSRVRRVQPTGVEEPVFNLTVEGEHEYFANGILVSNCDSALYAHRESYHHRFREKPVDPAPGSVESTLREERELERYAIEAQHDEQW